MGLKWAWGALGVGLAWAWSVLGAGRLQPAFAVLVALLGLCQIVISHCSQGVPLRAIYEVPSDSGVCEETLQEHTDLGLCLGGLCENL